jgi:hypothetical protein
LNRARVGFVLWAALGACEPADGPTDASCPASIDDGDACTTDACDAATGVISHDPVPVDDGDACTTDACDPATGDVTHEPVPVEDDDDVCTLDACDPASGQVHEDVDVDDEVTCTVDACDPDSGPFHVADDGLCDDADACTVESCDAALDCQWAYTDAAAVGLLSGELPAPYQAFAIPGIPLATVGPFTGRICPSGSNVSANPPVCMVEQDFANAELEFEALPDGGYRSSGRLPVRVANMPVTYDFAGNGGATLSGNQACTPPQSALWVPIQVDLRTDAGPGDRLDVQVSVGFNEIADGLTVCGGLTGASYLQSQLALVLESALRDDLRGEVERQLCAPAPCPEGTTDTGGVCRDESGRCLARARDPLTSNLDIPACDE